MNIGIHSWVLETRYPLSQAISRAAHIGYDGYEVDIGNFGGTGLGLQILPDRMSDENRQEIFQAKSSSGISICSLCLGALWHYPLSGNDSTYRKRGVEITRATISLAKFLGSDTILLPIGQPKDVSDEQAWQNTVISLESCLDLAEKEGVVLAIENVCSHFLLGAQDFIRMVDQIGSPNLKVYYDVANNAWLEHDPAAEILALGSRLQRLHFKNRPDFRKSGNSVTNSVGDPGIVNFQSVAEAIRFINYSGWIVVEVPTLDLDADEVAVRNLQAIRRLEFGHPQSSS